MVPKDSLNASHENAGRGQLRLCACVFVKLLFSE